METTRLRFSDKKRKKAGVHVLPAGKFFILPISLFLLLFASCGKDDAAVEPNGPAIGGGDIKFEIGFAPQGGAAFMNAGLDAPQTRAATDAEFRSTWQSGDVIGIFAVKRAASASAALSAENNYIHNVKLTYSSANGGSWSGPAYWPNDGSVVDFYAYYPYDANATDPTGIAFHVTTDQNVWVNGRPLYNRADLMTAKSTGKSKGETVTLQFSHALAMIQVNIPSAGKGFGPGEATSVSLRGVKLNSTLNLGAVNGPEAILAAGDNPAQDVKMIRVESENDDNYSSSYSYRALIPVQTIAAGGELFRIFNEEAIYRGSGPSTELVLTAGWAEKFTRSILNTLHTVNIPAGEFRRGSPGNELDRADDEIQHRVSLSKGFRITRYEITNAQFAEFLNDAGVPEHGRSPQTNRTLIYPNSTWNVLWNGNRWEPAPKMSDVAANCVTWFGADEYARWAGGALPTEAQWEWACRAGTSDAYPILDFTGDGSVDVDDLEYYAWFKLNSQGSPKKIGRLEPNEWGVYDMLGNVSEWCADWYDSTYGFTPDQLADPDFTASDPIVLQAGTERVVRGGNYNSFPPDCRSAARFQTSPNYYKYTLGFRVVFTQ